MPYIKQDERAKLEPALTTLLNALDLYHHGVPAGVLNYLITRILIHASTPRSYARINELVGMLACAQLEYYRRFGVPYEQTKIEENGDVYPIS